MRRVLISFLLAAVFFSASPARGDGNIWEQGDAAGYGSKRMFEWLATKGEKEYVISSFTYESLPFKGKTPHIVYFRGNGTCEVVSFAPAGEVEVEIMRGTWKIASGKLEMMLTSLEAYGEGSTEALVPPAAEVFEFADWQDIRFIVCEPKKRMFEGIASELKREYLVGDWRDFPFAPEGFDWYDSPSGSEDLVSIYLALEEDGEYELCYDRATNEPDTTEARITTMWGTWAIVDNKLELTRTSQMKHWRGDIQEAMMEELDPPVVETYEITDLQYLFDIPKEFNRGLHTAEGVAAFIRFHGLLSLGTRLTMHIGETQLWN